MIGEAVFCSTLKFAPRVGYAFIITAYELLDILSIKPKLESNCRRHFQEKHATSQNKKRATMSCTFNALLLVLDTFGNVPSCVKVESTERVKVPGSVDDGAENSIVGIWQRPIFVIYEVVECGLCRLQNLQRCYSLRHLWLSYNKGVKSTHCVSILVLR